MKWKSFDRCKFKDIAHTPLDNGWCKDIYKALSDGSYAVLLRKVQTVLGEVIHMAIRNRTNTDIPWAEKQRIKNEIAGHNRTAVEVFPVVTKLVDKANMYHLWVLPEGFSLPFGLSDEEAGGSHDTP